MTRSDLVISLVKTAYQGNMKNFRLTVEAIIAESRAKNHKGIANTLENMLKKHSDVGSSQDLKGREMPLDTLYCIDSPQCLSELILSAETREAINELVEEHRKRNLLRSYNLEPKNRVLLYGPPGNGKTSLAGALANELCLPFYVLKYEDLIESYLGNTARKLDEVFKFVQAEKCVFFLDEFESIAKERGDKLDSGEIKRIVSSLLIQLDNLNPNVILVAATNHTSLVDKAFWRRFQLHVNLPNPSKDLIKDWFDLYMTVNKRDLGVSADELSGHFEGRNFSEVESFALDVFRKFVLQPKGSEIESITKSKLELWKSRITVQ